MRPALALERSECTPPTIVYFLRVLLDHGAGLESRDGQTRTPLMVALLANQTDASALLLSRGADPEARMEPSGFTPLLIAVQQCSADAVQLLLDRNVSLEAKLEDGTSALYLASFKGFQKISSLLLKAGADLKTENNR